MKFKKKLLMAVILFAAVSTVLNAQTVKDIDGNTYKTVKIGDQIWMIENLNVSHFQNGDLIPEAKTNKDFLKAGKEKEPVWCFYNNDPKNGEKYGKLYNWYAINDLRGFTPEGWHIPNSEEWTQLTDHLGGNNLVAIKLKSIDAWDEKDIATNESGFSANPGGVRYFTGTFAKIGSEGYWWSSTMSKDNYVEGRSLFSNDKGIITGSFGKNVGASVRCIRD